jgi:hypothetical protein
VCGIQVDGEINMTASVSERTIEAGLENNAELIKGFYTFMVFDAGPVTNDSIVPVNRVITKNVSTTRDGKNLNFVATVNEGEVAEAVDIVAVWLGGKEAADNDVFLAMHEIDASELSPSSGITYTLPYTISGYYETYEE